MRRNDDVYLKGLKQGLLDWYKLEYGCDLDLSVVSKYVEKMVCDDTELFLFKRLGHLKGEDLLVFRDILNGKEEILREPTREEAAQVADDTGVARQSEESVPDAGKGVRSRRNLNSKRHSSNGSKSDS